MNIRVGKQKNTTGGYKSMAISWLSGIDFLSITYEGGMDAEAMNAEIINLENLTRIHQWVDDEAMAAKVMDIPLGNLTRIQRWMIQENHQLHVSGIFHKVDLVIQGILIPILSLFGIFGEPVLHYHHVEKNHIEILFFF